MEKKVPYGINLGTFLLEFNVTVTIFKLAFGILKMQLLRHCHSKEWHSASPKNVFDSFLIAILLYEYVCLNRKK